MKCVVGKQYKTQVGPLIWDCVYADENYAVMKSGKSGMPGVWAQDKDNSGWFSEYTEPVVEFVELSVKKTGSHWAQYYCNQGDDSINNLVGKLKLTFINDKLTNVEIIG